MGRLNLLDWTLRRVGVAVVAALIFCACPIASASASAQQRVALVIGNSAYTSKPLANPAHDAALISKTLQSTGFEVTTLVDADQTAMRKAMLEFGRRLRGTESTGVFYYAGHGVQVDGENYLIPVAADIKDLEDVALNGVSLSELLRAMERSGGVNLAILDACRDNPFASKTRSAASGLAPVASPSGTMIAFATAPGRVALDGTGDNSPYTTALSEMIPSEGATIEDMFKRTRRKVMDATNGRQTPWEHSSLTGEFYFRPKTAAPEQSQRLSDGNAGADERFKELAAWESVKGSADAKPLQDYLGTYPNSVFAELAQLRLAKLEAQKKTVSWPWTIADETSGISRDVPEAEGLYEEALKLDSPKSTAADLTASVTLYRRAAESGLPAAMFSLGRAYDKGRGVERNLAQALQWYRAAADKGHAGAMASLGTMYEFGEGTDVDIAGAFRLYKQAADLQDANAMTSLAYLYATGKGIAADQKEARRWYEEAAHRGQTRAMFNLALMKVRGEGGPADTESAVSLLQNAANKGHPGALRELAAMHDQGRGVKRDPIQAADYLIEAYAAANDKAREDLMRRPELWSVPSRREVQRKLQARGFYSGRLSGVFDTATRQGLKRLAAER